jgi:hypothetical protein
MSSGAQREPAWASRRLFIAWKVVFLVAAVINVVAQVTAGDGRHHFDFWQSAAGVLFIVALAAMISDYLLKRRMKRHGRWPEDATGPMARQPIDYSLPQPQDGSVFTGRADQAPLQEWLN